ncbi:trypsin-like peptidase domain-containing protein [Tundrisphaera sp. TA3]|uniref:trypsin-like peptidase domain-containing protein n=1 Tax=Tundrisphaera sp. TA3 TaxID=3435775 RepID=UPI003EBBE994
MFRRRTRPRSIDFVLVALAALAGPGLLPGRAPGQNEAETLSVSFRTAARRALPAVVSIRPQAPIGAIVPPFGIPPILPGRMAPGGSGVVIDAARGLILTNDHVLGDGGPVVVSLGDGRERQVARADRDPKSDLALLTLADPSGLVQAEWGESQAIDIGDWVLAIGQPFGLSGTVTAGIVSGKGRGVGLALYEDLIQTDAAINPGNSGGPLINLRGEIVGITTAMKTAGGGFEGVGFALPSSRARRVADELAAFGRVRRSFLGINIRRVDPPTAARLGRPDAAMIFGVVEGSPAAQAGLRPGDVILQLGGRPINGTGPLQTAIEVAAVGEPLALTVDRDGESREITVVPAAQPDRFGLAPVAPIAPPTVATPPNVGPADEPPLRPDPAPTARLQEGNPGRVVSRFTTLGDLGLTLAEKEPGVCVVERVTPDGPADLGGLEAGMRITDLDGSPIRSIEDLLALSLPDRDVRVGIMRGPKPGVRIIPRPARTSGPAPEPAAPRLPAAAPTPRPDPN